LKEEPYPHEDIAGRPLYFFDDTEGSRDGVASPLPKDRDYVPNMVSHLQIIDDLDPVHQGKNLMFVTTDGRVVAYKLGQRERGRISLRKWRRHAKALRMALETQRNNPRGKRKRGDYARYVMFGFRREGNSKRVSRYVPKKGAKASKVAFASAGIEDLVTDLEEVGLNLVSDADLTVQNILRERDELGNVLINGYNGRFSQLAIATKYWVALHEDDDMFRTLLSCYASEKEKDKPNNDILFYFVFPSVGIAIPMRSTDILVFDSKFAHCASNYRCEDSLIFSCFTSSKTVNAHITNNNEVVMLERLAVDSDEEVGTQNSASANDTILDHSAQ
jgi:hypothetical protein